MFDDHHRTADALDADLIFREEFAGRAGARFTLRLAREEDRPFLRALFGEVLDEELRRSSALASGQLSLVPPMAGTPRRVRSVGSVPGIDERLLDLQFAGRSLSYASAYPCAHDYLTLLTDGKVPIGRMLVDWGAGSGASVLGIDLAVRPNMRAGAVGLIFLRAWIAVCDRLARRARLHVMPHNPARRIYERLGFVPTDANAFPLAMERAPRAR